MVQPRAVTILAGCADPRVARGVARGDACGRRTCCGMAVLAGLVIGVLRRQHGGQNRMRSALPLFVLIIVTTATRLNAKLRCTANRGGRTKNAGRRERDELFAVKAPLPGAAARALIRRVLLVSLRNMALGAHTSLGDLTIVSRNSFSIWASSPGWARINRCAAVRCNRLAHGTFATNVQLILVAPPHSRPVCQIRYMTGQAFRIASVLVRHVRNRLRVLGLVPGVCLPPMAGKALVGPYV